MIQGPAGIVEPGGIATFTATLDDSGQNYKPKIHWTVSGNGKIVGGQGTLTINIQLDKAPGGNVTATIAFEGLPKYCPTAGSAIAIWDAAPQPWLLDEFSPIKDPKLDAAKVADITLNVKRNPNSQLLILIYFRSGTSASSQTKQITKLRSRLTKNSEMDPSRITVVTTFSDPSRLKFYLVPPGASNPQP